MIVADWFRQDPVTCDPSDTVGQVARLMKERGVGSVVVAGDGRPLGIVTDRDIVLGVVAAGRDPAIARVADVMTSNPILARLDEDLLSITERFSENGIRRLPVVDDGGRLVGLISFDDTLRAYALAMRNVGHSVVAQQRDEARARDLEATDGETGET